MKQAAFVEHAARQLGERHLGAIVGKHLDYPDLGPYADYVLEAPNLATAFWRGTNALSFILTRSWVSMREEPGHVVLQFGTGIQSVVGGRQIDEGMVFVLIGLVRRYVGANWAPDWIELGAKPATGVSDLEDLFEAPIIFGHDLPAIAVRKSLLLAPNPVSRPPASALVRDDIGRMSGHKPPTTFTELVRDTMTAHLAAGDISVDTIAERLGLGARTLQRRLASEGYSYRDIRSMVLHQRARALLAETGMTVADVATALGFDEVNSFRRAFLNWTGSTPSSFAHRARAGELEGNNPGREARTERTPR